MNNFKMTVMIDPSDSPDLVEIVLTIAYVENHHMLEFASICAQINQDGIVDGTTNTWYPPYQIRKIQYEG